MKIITIRSILIFVYEGYCYIIDKSLNGKPSYIIFQGLKTVSYFNTIVPINRTARKDFWKFRNLFEFLNMQWWLVGIYAQLLVH